MSAQFGIYKRVSVLNKNTDKDLKVSPIKGYSYASGLQNCVLTINEYFESAKSQPIVFAKNDQGDYVSLAILGLAENENVFVKKNGDWCDNEYVPAFIRRYPFIFVQQEVGRFSLAIDRSNPCISKKGKEPLFTDTGELSPFADNIVKFMTSYEDSYKRTTEFGNWLFEKGLLEEATATLNPESEKDSFSLRGFMRIVEDKINELEDADKAFLMRTGLFKGITCQLISMSNFSKLLNIRDS